MGKKRKGTNLLKMLSMALMLYYLSLSVFAQENLAIITDNTQPEQIEETRRGSIAIHLDDTDNDLSKEYVEIALVKVATITSQGYELTPLFEESKVDLMGIETAEELVEASSRLEKFIPENVEVPSLKTDKNGQCVFENLEVGVYLLYLQQDSSCLRLYLLLQTGILHRCWKLWKPDRLYWNTFPYQIP